MSASSPLLSSWMHRATSLVCAALGGCSLWVSDPPTDLESEASTTGPDVRFDCEASAYSCTCRVSASGTSSRPYCVPAVTGTHKRCCASYEWPEEGICGCTVMSCSSIGQDRCGCEAQLTDGYDSCGDLGGACASVAGCFEADNPAECVSGEVYVDAPCSLRSVLCPEGQQSVSFCDFEAE